MLSVEIIYLIDGWCEEQSSFLKIELDLGRELLVLCGDVKQGLARSRLAVDAHLNCKIDNMPIFKQDYHLAVISHQRILVERKRLGEGHGEVQAMRFYQSW